MERLVEHRRVRRNKLISAAVLFALAGLTAYVLVNEVSGNHSPKSDDKDEKEPRKNFQTGVEIPKPTMSQEDVIVVPTNGYADAEIVTSTPVPPAQLSEVYITEDSTNDSATSPFEILQNIFIESGLIVANTETPTSTVTSTNTQIPTETPTITPSPTETVSPTVAPSLTPLPLPTNNTVINTDNIDLDVAWQAVLDGTYYDLFKEKGLNSMLVMCSGNEQSRMTFEMARTLSGEQSETRSDHELVDISAKEVSTMFAGMGVDFPTEGVIKVEENAVMKQLIIMNLFNYGKLKMCNEINKETGKYEPVFYTHEGMTEFAKWLKQYIVLQ